MDLPASYYGKLDKRNPVILGFVREINSFIAVIKRVASSTEDNSGYAKGVKILMEIWRKYKHRLPLNLYQEHMLQVADLLFELQFFDMALWYGYSLHMQQFTSVAILDIEGVDHFKACFFPKGLDTDQDTLNMKLRALHGCTLCIFEQEKSYSVLNRQGLDKLLCVLDFIRIMMQVLQQYDNLCWQIYNGSVLMYNICRYLMTMNYSAQALEYLLWASLSLELSVPLMTTKYVPWIVTLYCAVCECYYDNQAAVQAEVFARRALVKINELAKLEEQSGVPSCRETQKTYKEASIKLAAMIFKRAVFEARHKPKTMFRFKTKSSLADIPNAPWPRNTTEQILTSLFEGGAAQFLGILEALRDSSRHPLQTGGPDEHEPQEVVLELLAAGISILSGDKSTGGQKYDHQQSRSLRALTTSSTLINLAITGESKICFVSAMEFIKLLYYNKQSEAFAEYSNDMLQRLSCLEIHSFRKAELELTLLHHYNSVQKERPKTVMALSEEFIELVKTLHKSVCDSESDSQPNKDLVLSVILFVWDKVAFVIERTQRQHSRNFDKWVWCLSVLCEVASAFELSTVYCCIMAAEMTQKLAMLLESAAKHSKQKHSSDLLYPAVNESEGDAVTPQSFSISEGSSTQLFQRVRAVVKKGLHALSKGLRIMLPRDGSAVTDSAFVQKFNPSSPSTFSCSSEQGYNKHDAMITKEKQEDNEANLDVTTSQHSWTTDEFLLAVDLHLQLDTIYNTASLRLLHLNAVTESEVFGWIKKNKVTKALFLIQKAQLDYNMNPEPIYNIKNLLEEASTLIEKAGLEEKKLYMSTLSANQPALKSKDREAKDEKDRPPPPPVLISRTDYSLSFVPAPYHTKEQVCWYQLLGHAAQGTNLKVRLGDCSLPGTGRLVPAESGQCVLKVEGLDPNQKYVFAVAAYNSQGILLGHSIGETTFPLLASPPLPLLTTWALLAQVAFQTQQYDVAKRACKKLWSHFTCSEPRDNTMQYQLVTTRLHVASLRHSSLLLRQSLFASIFIETEINIHEGSLHCNFSDRGPFIWEQMDRLAECERMLVAMDLVLWLIDSSDALQAVLVCYDLLSPLIYHQITCHHVIQVLTKCLNVFEESSAQIKQRCSGNTSEILMHRIACITYYLYKALHGLREHEKAAMLMDCGCRLIQEVYDAQLQKNKLINKPKSIKKVDPVVKGKTKMSPQLKALLGKNKRNENLSTVTFSDDQCKMYDVVSSTTIKRAYQEVMKLRQKPVFIESSALLLQKALQEGEATLVIEWGQSFLEFLRKDLHCGSVVGTSQNKTKSTSVNEPQGDTRRKVGQAMVQRARTNREIRAVKNMSQYKKLVMLRRTRCEESVWRTNLNYALAQAHLVLFYQGLAQLHEGPLLQRYSHLDPLNFSVAYSGLSLRKRKNLQQQQPPKCDVVLEGDRNNHEAHRTDDSCTDRIDEKDDVSSLHNEQQAVASMLDSLNKAALHLRRAMVLAHRGGHWASLRCVCLTIWDQYCRTADIVQRGPQLTPPSRLTADKQCNIFTPLLVLATELVMDMLNQLGLWRVYERDLPEEEVESCLHFSAPLDDTTKMDMRWVKTLALHALEQLHNSSKWEKLAHLALLFNAYTRECYALIVTPLLIHAQRKLLERIRLFRGPAVPQPHHVKTQKVTGYEVTHKSYAGCQLLSGWTSPPQEMPMLKKEALTNNRTELKDAEVQRSMALVCVPLDVEDTLYWYRKAVEKRSHCRQFFQHSRTLLLLHLANTQPYYATQFSRSKEPSRSANLVEFNPTIMSAPSVKPHDLMEEDYSTPEALYSLPVSPEHMHVITAAYTTSINYFHDSRRDSLRVLALHEMGNLHYYNGNTKSAHSCWTNALNCALKSPDALEKWDGVSFGGCSLQQRLKLSGMWGCLQAACLTAKTAQYIVTSDISQRTNCCLQSAHLFKCVLCCSLAQPQSDIQYVSDIVIDELMPGVELFSDPFRVHLGTTIASLNFICHWLFVTGYYIKLLPMLALYLHFVGTVCRDVQRTVECKILKIRALTELGLFTEAVKEAINLTKGAGIRLPHGHYISQDKDHNGKTFNNNKSVLDNTEALEELVNCDFTPGVRILYGSPLCLRYNLVRTQLILAICATIYSPLQVPGPVGNSNDCVTSEQSEQEDPESKGIKQPKILDLESVKEELTPGQIKYLLLEAVSTLLSSITKQLTTTSLCHVEKVELTVESNLLMAKLYLLKGQAVLSSEMAVSSLALLQSTFENMNAFKSGYQKKTSQLQVAIAGSEEGSNQPFLDGDLKTVEASERIGFSLWQRCRLTLIHGLTAHAPGNGVSVPGNNINKEVARAIRDGIEECTTWGDPDSQALLMLEGAQWDSNISKTDKSTLVKEIVSLLSGRLNMPLRSTITLAQATMLLSDMKAPENITFLKLSQKLLQNQMCCFSQNIVLDDGELYLPCSSNICLPFLHVSHLTTSRIGQILGS